MNPPPLGNTSTVLGQFDATDIAKLGGGGVRRIANVCPGSERLGHHLTAETVRVSAGNGMAHRHISATTQSSSWDVVGVFAEAPVGSGLPTYAHGSSGLYAITPWASGEVVDGHLHRDEAQDRVAEIGFDLTPSLAWLDQIARQRASDGTGAGA